MLSIKKSVMTNDKGTKCLASPQKGCRWIISLVLALQTLAAPTHLLGMSIHSGDMESVGNECPMPQEAVGDSGQDDSCECSGGLCSVGSASQYARTGSELFDPVLRATGRVLLRKSARYAPDEHHSLYQSRAPPSISLS